MKIIVAYTKRNCVTGLQLFRAIKSKLLDHIVKRIVDERKRPRNPDVIVRLGNSRLEHNAEIEFNTKDSIKKCSNKLTMITLLKNNPSLKVIDFTTDLTQLDNFKDADGCCFIRGRDMKVRYNKDFSGSDLYFSKPVNKTREYRVQVFDGKVVGIYEKIPQDVNTKLYKSDTCKFVRCDPEISRCNKEVQQMCIEAVSTLGLIFGGVDVIRERKTKLFYITEVNSGLGLNGPNIEKFADLIIGKIIDLQNTGG